MNTYSLVKFMMTDLKRGVKAQYSVFALNQRSKKNDKYSVVNYMIDAQILLEVTDFSLLSSIIVQI